MLGDRPLVGDGRDEAAPFRQPLTRAAHAQRWAEVEDQGDLVLSHLSAAQGGGAVLEEAGVATNQAAQAEDAGPRRAISQRPSSDSWRCTVVCGCGAAIAREYSVG